MSAVAVFLVALGVADLCRRAARAVWPPLMIGPVAVMVCAALGSLWHRGDIALIVLAAVAAVVWEWLWLRSGRSGREQVAPLARVAAALVVLIGLAGWCYPVN